MKIAVIGTGYVGLVTAACFANLGHAVIGVDKDEEKIERLNRGEVTIYEVGLPELLLRNLGRNLNFTTNTDNAVRVSEIVFITVGTPQGEEGEADMSYVVEAASEIAASIKGYKIIVNKSTMPVGSTRLVERVIKEKAGGEEFDVVSNPEFLREGTAVRDFMNPDRIVVGTESQKAAGIMSELYRSLKAPLFITDAASAEMIKYASNAFLATKVSFINAIANICEATGADVKEVALGMGYDHRIGFEFLRSGPGFGGSCFPKDCQALIEIARGSGYHFYLLEGVMQVNREQMELTAGKVERRLGELSGKAVAVWGLAFKANTDDVRDSPAVEIVRLLLDGGAKVRVYDPQAMENARTLLPEGVEYARDPLHTVTDADLLLILTDWDEFKMQDFRKVGELMKSREVLDARNCLEPLSIRRLGFNYEGIGR
ncbi:MAG: UDP-glucose/GDP-mannose dehydrogenase family protein [Actinobacteria bacterium]|jgi:UDPglucose 6-dehydrogenase|nr:MAG: UDP-glucose/GDP-mannose dehydrogenase family protein [Actinomycetota bacterium]